MVSVKTREARLITGDSKWNPAKLPVFPLALVIVLVISGAVANVWKKGDALASAHRSWTWWTVDAVNRSKQKHDIVLLGSSLMVVAMAECDATVFNNRFDLTRYRSARYFDDIRGSADSTNRSINLAAPGQIPSDALMTMKAAWKAGIRPTSVIYGVAPRDFVDGTLSSPLDTEAFVCLKQLVSSDDVRELVSVSPLDRAKESLLGFCELRQRSEELSTLTDKCVASILGKPARQAQNRAHEPFDLRWRMR
ncbi:MAG: hypothetical protein K2Z81_06900, partial [Cyanobacteria bacterium]|nr:hypothetical protein [Cyanobacteriota bacterium]